MSWRLFSMPRSAQAYTDSNPAFRLGWTKMLENYFAEYYQKRVLLFELPIFELVSMLHMKENESKQLLI